MYFNKTAKIGSAFIVSLLLMACMDGDKGGVSTKGHSIFTRVANQEVEYALSGTIQKEPGFNSNCSVDKDTDSGILITRGVCDNDNSFTIRATNTSDYPPSKRLKFLSLHIDNIKIKLYPGEIKEIIGPDKNKISIELSRTGASLFIEGTRPRATSSR